MKEGIVDKYQEGISTKCKGEIYFTYRRRGSNKKLKETN